MPVSIDGAGSGVQRAVGAALELHEHVVPDLDVAIAVARRAAADRLGAGQLVAAEVVDLRAAAARPGVAHLPEVVVRAELADRDRPARTSRQSVVRLVVARDAGLALEDRSTSSRSGRQLPDVGQQLPGERESRPP